MAAPGVASAPSPAKARLGSCLSRPPRPGSPSPASADDKRPAPLLREAFPGRLVGILGPQAASALRGWPLQAGSLTSRSLYPLAAHRGRQVPADHRTAGVGLPLACGSFQMERAPRSKGSPQLPPASGWRQSVSAGGEQRLSPHREQTALAVLPVSLASAHRSGWKF